MAASPRFRNAEVVEVLLWGARVGAVALDPRLGFYVFEYAPEFVRRGLQPSPLMMPLRSGQPYVFTDLPEATFRRLPGLLCDALPDDFGNALIDAWMAERGVGRDAVTPLDRLAYLGRRAMGALEFKPARGPSSAKSTVLELTTLVEVARDALHGDLARDHAAAALKQLISVGTSAGGARAKAVITWNRATNELRTGQLDASPGFEHWLLKFDGVGPDHELGAGQPYGRIEYAYAQMARAAGLEMSDCHLLEEGGRAHFMTRRFDRVGGKKLHLQSLCGLAHLDYKQRGTHAYLQYFETVARLGLGRLALEEAFRRMVFNVQACNRDDHTKNFAFLLAEGGEWRLAPAYDLSFAYNPKGEWTREHQLSVNGKFHQIGRDDVAVVADRLGLGNWRALVDQVAAGTSRWKEFAAAAGVSKKRAREIEACFAPL